MSSASGESETYAVIEVRLRQLGQLFNSLDPSPFHERDLDEDAEDYIVGSAREADAGLPIRILIHLPEAEIAKAGEAGLAHALENYFLYRAEAARRELRELFRIGRRNLGVGVPILLACLAASHFASSLIGPGPLARTIEESLIIVGWVANWKPIETFLYDWWPLKRRLDLYSKLAKAKVDVEPHE